MIEHAAIRRIRIEYRGDVPPTEISVDLEVEGCYIRLRLGEVASTVEHSPGVHVDLDGDGLVLGVEVLGSAKQVNWDTVGEKYIADSDALLRDKLRTAARYVQSV